MSGRDDGVLRANGVGSLPLDSLSFSYTTLMSQDKQLKERLAEAPMARPEPFSFFQFKPTWLSSRPWNASVRRGNRQMLERQR
jgi:hypothetical protein